MSKLIQIVAALCLVFVTGCSTNKAAATFNRETLYSVPPSGLWVESVLYLNGKQWTHTGRMWIPPGVYIGAGE